MKQESEELQCVGGVVGKLCMRSKNAYLKMRKKLQEGLSLAMSCCNALRKIDLSST